MKSTPPSRDPFAWTISEPRDAAPSRRTLMSQLSAAAMAMMIPGALTDGAWAAPGGSKPPQGGTVEPLPDGLRILLRGFQIDVRQLAAELIGLEVAPADDPGNPVYSSTHSGVLTDEMIDQITQIGQLQLRHADVNRFNAGLRSLGIDGVSSTEGGFVLIGVLFILLVIIGAGFGIGGGG